MAPRYNFKIDVRPTKEPPRAKSAQLKEERDKA
jgi:hypothetical protein